MIQSNIRVHDPILQGVLNRAHKTHLKEFGPMATDPVATPTESVDVICAVDAIIPDHDMDLNALWEMVGVSSYMAEIKLPDALHRLSMSEESDQKFFADTGLALSVSSPLGVSCRAYLLSKVLHDVLQHMNNDGVGVTFVGESVYVWGDTHKSCEFFLNDAALFLQQANFHDIEQGPIVTKGEILGVFFDMENTAFSLERISDFTELVEEGKEITAEVRAGFKDQNSIPKVSRKRKAQDDLAYERLWKKAGHAEKSQK